MHLSKSHKIKYEDYIVKHYNNGIKPSCPVCQNPTRYDRGSNAYKKYCTEHSNVARAEWSKNNGYGANQDAGWRRGLNKDNNEVIRRHSEWMTGQNNPMHKDNPKNKKDDDANS